MSVLWSASEDPRGEESWYSAQEDAVGLQLWGTSDVT